MPTYTTLKGFSDFGDKSVSEIISDNLITFFDWGFIDKGAFFNVTIPTSGAYGGEKDNLAPVNDPNYNSGQVWQSFHKNWIWESGLSTATQPISISGVYVDSTFYPTSGNANSHHFDYPNGRVVFESSVPTTSTVELEYSYKYLEVTSAQNIPWFRRVQTSANRVDNPHFTQLGSGDWNNIGYTRVQLPTIAVEINPIGDTRPYALGTGARYARHTVLCHILAESDNMARRLADILADQTHKNIYLFDSNMIAASSAFPLDYRGMTVSNPLTYPDLVAHNNDGGYRWRRLRFIEGEGRKVQELHPELYYATTRLEVEVVLTEV